MGVFDKFRKKETEPALPSEPGTVYVPLAGTVIALEEIGDGVFSEGILGPGCGIEPTEETLYAPFAGTITQVADTKHAIGLTSADGIELLIHVGMDTVEMNGNGFTPYVKIGDTVVRGQKLLDVSLSAIKKAGYPATTAVVICNADEIGMPQELKRGAVQVGDVLLKVR